MSYTIEDKIAEGKGFTSGFDYLRIFLSLGVLIWHCFAVVHFDDATAIWGSLWRALPAFILPMFFALSGYLVAGSIQRLRLHQFATMRVLRIVPALAFETFLTALVLGPLFTVLPLAVYFSSGEFFSYFLNIAGYIHYTLPGVFGGRTLNAQLWTIPSELECYVLLMLASLIGLVGRRGWFALTVAIAAVAMTFHAFGGETLNPFAPLGGRVLVFSFLAGVLTFLYRDKISYSTPLFVICAALSIVLLTFTQTSYLAAFPVAYTTAWLGLKRPPQLSFGDLSYGVFLYHFPLLVVVHETSGGLMPWPIYVVIVLPLALACASVSWFCIEKPILHRKLAISGATDRFVASIAARTRVARSALGLGFARSAPLLPARSQDRE